MPLIHIYMLKGKSADYKNRVSEGLHEALLAAWKIPEHDCFQIITEKKLDDFRIDRTMWGVKRSDDVIVFHITSAPRTQEMKLELHALLPKVMHEKVNLRPEDVFISIINNNAEDWSFGNGKAQLMGDGS